MSGSHHITINRLKSGKINAQSFLLIAALLLCFNSLHVSAASASACLKAPIKTFPSQTTIRVSTVSELHAAVDNLQNNTTVLIRPGNYQLQETLYIKKPGVTIRGDSDECDAVSLIGPGMENANFGDVRSGIWINANNVTVANLTIRDVYFHPIELNSGPDGIDIYNVRMIDAGQQFVKASSAGGFGLGGDFGRVEYSIMEYTNGPPKTDHGGGTGYTNGVDVHGGNGWVIRNNLFKNFHTPDNADHLWSPAILMWNGSRNTLVENNTFINVDRAIAFGLVNRSNDHQGGIIRNNMITMTPGLYSNARRSSSDAPIIIWSSPGTKVLHNTVLTNGNTLKSIELRFGSSGVEVINNLTDGPIVYREGAPFSVSGNNTVATPQLFVAPATGDLHVKATSAGALASGSLLADAPIDFDGQQRPSQNVTLGADQYSSSSPVTGGARPLGFLAMLMLLMDD